MKKRFAIAFVGAFLLVVALFLISSKQDHMSEPSAINFLKGGDDEEFVLDGDDEEYVFLLGYED